MPLVVNGNAVDWFAEIVTNPSPASLPDLLSHRHMTVALPQSLIADDFIPLDTKDSSQTAVVVVSVILHVSAP